MPEKTPFDIDAIITPEESMAALEATVAAEESSATGQVVHL